MIQPTEKHQGVFFQADDDDDDDDDEDEDEHVKTNFQQKRNKVICLTTASIFWDVPCLFSGVDLLVSNE